MAPVGRCVWLVGLPKLAATPTYDGAICKLKENITGYSHTEKIRPEISVSGSSMRISKLARCATGKLDLSKGEP